MNNVFLCPVCRRKGLQSKSADARIHRENNLPEDFVKRNLGHRPDGPESKDLTRFMHGGPASFLSCPSCGTLLRDDEQPAKYEKDLYDSDLMAHLYPRYVGAFEQKRSQFQPVAGARGLFAGSVASRSDFHLELFRAVGRSFNGINDRLLRDHRSEPIATHNSSLLTPPYPDMSQRVQHEWLEARRQGESPHSIAGPWIEITSRRT